MVLGLCRRPPHGGRVEGGAGPEERIVPDGPARPRAEVVVTALLLLAAALALGFVVVYALDRLPDQTQLLGLCLGLALLCIAAALVVTGEHLVVTEHNEEEYPVDERTDEQDALVQLVEESGSRIDRGRLLRLGVGAAGGSLGLALLTPIASLGPVFDMESLYAAPWVRGRRLVDADDRPLRAADIEPGAFFTAFPEGANKEDLGAAIVLVRLAASDLRLPAANAHFDASGIVAYSKICTHAGCAIALYRTPLFPAADPKPALVCPCHYSTFDPGAAGKVLYGPAGRKLPMLPLAIDAHGELRAAGNFDGPVGPSWWGVRLRGPRP
jgi:ubiquinol-cytochrome c reductase iron-sulfur subunit